MKEIFKSASDLLQHEMQNAIKQLPNLDLSIASRAGASCSLYSLLNFAFVGRTLHSRPELFFSLSQ